MMTTTNIVAILIMSVMLNMHVHAQSQDQTIDERVTKYLESKKGTWRNWNIPYEDGQVLYDLIIDNDYKRALEIGTSTGHSSIWMAWALSKTGGKLITIEIDEVRHREALEAFRDTGLSDYIDARLGDAHVMVRELEGPFDFVFSDADKSWYKQYFIDVDPLLAAGGCFTAHNVSNPYGGIQEFLDYVQSLDTYSTFVDKSSRAGISISYKK